MDSILFIFFLKRRGGQNLLKTAKAIYHFSFVFLSRQKKWPGVFFFLLEKNASMDSCNCKCTAMSHPGVPHRSYVLIL